LADSSEHRNLVCAVDLGGTNLRAANIDWNGVIHERVRQPTPANDSAEIVVATIAGAVHDCQTQSQKRGAQVERVAVVAPGSVDAHSGRVVNAPNVASLQGYELGAALRAELGCPVLLENDANAAALGEMWQGAARGHRTIICFTLGTGVGSGIILEGKLWRGIDGIGGEIGHTSVDPFAGVTCKCGNVGCLEVYASATGIVRLTREELPAYPSSVLCSMDAQDLSSRKIFDAAIKGDELALKVFRRAGTYLGVVMASTVNIFNPEMIVVGGGVSAAFDLFVPQAQAEVLKRAFPMAARRCRIARAECGDDAGLLGAARLAFGEQKQS
jgi:glucokinase